MELSLPLCLEETLFLKRGDRVYFITDSEGVEELYKLTGAEKRSIKKVMILGGSNIGRTLAEKTLQGEIFS